MANIRQINGIHHITAVTASAAANVAFYETVLGLRLVKQTVNFDDPHTYHLYFGDDDGTPGTILTFFPWEQLPQGRPGAGMVTGVAFSVARHAIHRWRLRLSEHGIKTNESIRFGDPVLSFSDPDGLPLELVGVGDTDIPGKADTAITGFHSAAATVNDASATRSLLEGVLGMTFVQSAARRQRFRTGEPGHLGRYFDLVVDPAAPPGRAGAGTVHHIAFRTTDDAGQARWQKALRDAGIPATDVRDRKYFRSIYFNGPEGILFEIATDPPGFAIDEDKKSLGSALQLPSQYESIREEIERRLPPLRPSDYQHLFLPGEGRAPSRRTLVPLHGTGGSEHDLIELSRRLDPAAAVISPRGQVLENGMLRFFRRLADGVFDTADVIRRAGDLSHFLNRAFVRYRRPADALVALGYSNGANMAAAVMLHHPAVFSAAILLRPMMVPLPSALPDLSGVSVLMISGSQDRVIPRDSARQLETALGDAGATVEHRILDAGHGLTPADVEIAADWLEALSAETRAPEPCGEACAA